MADAADSYYPPSVPWSLFHGDPQLADFFFKRWRWHAKAGHIEVSRRPFWRGGKGTASAALVHNAAPQVFCAVASTPARSSTMCCWASTTCTATTPNTNWATGS
ncbi:hypothetical protein [Pseudomonas typographi]|uniref:Uncharacterized protein n=1 Tax=Pseudomonas typographi TaxID=2715964 RepID=A0ABR7Z7D7_9PSED|nr:hypothetical protein [Pseudomonas typographi]MBD1554505.1 hypothetical protein [Pseudomonas typographi]MBD1589555.1 hypothetical protein [Pseudomonas typographi]MBD1601380.1 hypothetical protein [Pseudomonas typographi]